MQTVTCGLKPTSTEQWAYFYPNHGVAFNKTRKCCSVWPILKFKASLREKTPLELWVIHKGNFSHTQIVISLELSSLICLGPRLSSLIHYLMLPTTTVSLISVHLFRSSWSLQGNRRSHSTRHEHSCP